MFRPDRCISVWGAGRIDSNDCGYLNDLAGFRASLSFNICGLGIHLPVST